MNVIYDGRCGFCIRSLRVVRALDRRRLLHFLDAHQPETIDRFPQLKGLDLSDAMYVIVDGEPPHRGFFAFRRILWTNPTMWPLIPVFYFPLASVIGPKVYEWIAKNRSSFGCESDFCAVPDHSGAKLTRQGQL